MYLTDTLGAQEAVSLFFPLVRYRSLIRNYGPVLIRLQTLLVVSRDKEPASLRRNWGGFMCTLGVNHTTLFGYGQSDCDIIVAFRRCIGQLEN